MISRDVRSVRFASSRSPCPLRRATTAVMPVFIAKNMHSISMRGCPTRPTAAMASVPIPPTIIVSMEPISEISTISHTLGSAIRRRFMYASFVEGTSPCAPLLGSSA